MLELETIIKYLIIQSIGSLLLLTSLTFRFFFPIFLEIIMIRIIIKIGIFPFYFWVPVNIIMIDWFTFLIFSRVIKFPLIIFIIEILNLNQKRILTIVFILGAIIISIHGNVQTNLKLIIIFSSLTHLSWVLILSIFNKYVSWIYFLIYLIETIIFIIFIIKREKSSNYNFNLLTSDSNSSIIIINLITLSLAGLPPFLGFLKKLIAIIRIIQKRSITIILLILSSLISLYFYFIYSLNSIFSFNKIFLNLNNLNLVSVFFVFFFFIFINLKF